MRTNSLVAFSMFLSLIVSAQTRAAGDANNKIFVFHGKIQAVDTAARTFTLQMDKQSYVFVVTDQTKIVRNGKAQQFADLKQGQFAEVEMKLGPGGKGMAVVVRLGFSSRELNSRVHTLQLQSLAVAPTPDGKTISGKELDRLIVHRSFLGRRGPASHYGPLKTGVFLLSVRPDGTVSNVEMLHSVGYDKLDKRAAQSMKEMRFRRNSVVQVRVPIQFSRQRYF